MIYMVSDGTQLQTMVGATFRFRENVFGGVAYRGYSGPLPMLWLFLAGWTSMRNYPSLTPMILPYQT